ncbi:MAG: HD domain-containing protein [Firmicutes bacterium]|nr:HD domain-containing protein [Bacillota bacterium]
MKKLDTDLFDRAAIFAIKAHSGVERRGKGTPYALHVMEAAAIAETMTKDPEIIAAALLHDVIEDTDYTYEDIKAEFGQRVADLVLAESDEEVSGKTDADSWKERKIAGIKRLKKLPRDAQIVTMADKLSNMRAIARDYSAIGDKLWKRFHVSEKSEHAWRYKALADAFTGLEDTEAYKEFRRLVEEVFGK